MLVDVSLKGTVILGRAVTCDGFRAGVPIRVQTHVHADHMTDFDTSKGNQDFIITSQGTRDLLIAERNADLSYRDNFRALDYSVPYQFDGGRLILEPSGHMLGASQVLVEYEGEGRLAYSGDFQWPLERPVKTDTLVVDSTYGETSLVRRYSQEQANESLLDLVSEQLRRGPVIVQAYRGTIQRVLQLFTGNVVAPIVVSMRLSKEINVYRRHGYMIPPVIPVSSPEYQAAKNLGAYVACFAMGDRIPSLDNKTYIRVSAFMSDPDSPVRKFTDRAFLVALSDHADYAGTLEYVRATGASLVITDNTRAHGIDLALAIQRELGISARPSSNFFSSSWGS